MLHAERERARVRLTEKNTLGFACFPLRHTVGLSMLAKRRPYPPYPPSKAVRRARQNLHGTT